MPVVLALLAIVAIGFVAASAGAKASPPSTGPIPAPPGPRALPPTPAPLGGATAPRATYNLTTADSTRTLTARVGETFDIALPYAAASEAYWGGPFQEGPGELYFYGTLEWGNLTHYAFAAKAPGQTTLSIQLVSGPFRTYAGALFTLTVNVIA